MADMLKFRKGTYAQINAAPKAAGTIYIAKDEKAMYVDVDASTRIRIGDFIRVASIEEIPQPYSETAVYYVEGANALLGYKDGKWKQINGTEELVTKITAVEGKVSALEGTVGNAASGLVKDVNDLKTTVGDANSGLVKDVADNAKDIEALQAALGLGDGEESDGTLAGSVAQLRTDLTTLEKEVHGTDGNGGMVATLGNHQSRIAALEEKDVALKSDVTVAKSAVLGQVEGVDFNGTVKGAYDAAATAQTQADKGVADAAAAKAAADTNKENLSALTGRVTALDQAGTGRVAVLESKVDTLEKAGYATVTQVNTAKSEVLGTEADAAGTATVHGALKSAAAADAKAVAAANAASAAQGDIDAWEEAHANDYTNTKIDELVAAAKKAGDDAQADFDAYETAHANDYTNKQIDDKITTVTNAASAAQGAANAAQEDATQALTDAAAAQKTADDYIAAHANDYTNTQIDSAVADAKKAGTDAGTQAETNRQNIASLTATVDKLDGTVETEGSVKKQIKDAVDAAKTALSAEIDADIRAANAMEYAGTIESASAIPTSGVKNGATYVIGTSFDFYAAGDMLIAQGTEDPDTGLITNPTWAHVKSGYDATLDQQLTGANNQIMLSNGVRNDADAAGAITFAATGSASVSVTNNTVTIGMVWEDFDPQV